MAATVFTRQLALRPLPQAYYVLRLEGGKREVAKSSKSREPILLSKIKNL
jgi:hypothetical protein